ncbi:ligand-binding sensor domain-containing protein [Algoriphagus lacus]|uniref:ligand-binding sensor domain-containing protein n=1 Tax=Algoriphagus lacus TaxID=2056311 RepID=UPI0011C493E5|nr:two-component regulator propeller domain-containing protein [Algoriphagus lacus]
MNKNSVENSNDYVLEIWDNSNGLPQNAVFAMEKDNMGYLWAATEEGLVRLDGTTPKVFDQETYPIMLEQTYYTFFKSKRGIWATADRSIALLQQSILEVIDCSTITEKTWIRAIFETENGELLIGTQSGKIHVWKDNTFSILDFWKPNIELEILSFYPLSSTKLLIGTTRGLYEVDLNLKKSKIVTQDTFVAQKVFGSDTSVFVSSGSGLFRVRENYEMEMIISYDDYRDINPTSLIKDSEDRIWAGSLEKGLLLIEGRNVSRINFPELKNYTVRKIIKERDNIYLGTLGKGLVIVKPAKVKQLKFDSLKEKNVKPIFQANDSSIWIGTKADGIFRIKGDAIQSWTTNDGLIQNGVTTIGSLAGKIYVGSGSGISVIDYKSRKVIETITVENGLKSNYVYAIYQDSKKRLWILTRNGGIHYLDENGLLKLVELPTLYNQTNFISILELKNNQLIIGSMNQGVFWIENEKFTQNQKLPLTPGEDIVYSIYEDEKENLWFGTHGGIIFFKDGRFRSLKKINGLKSRSVYSIIPDPVDGIWITNNFGVQYFSDSELENFKKSTDQNFFLGSTFFNKQMGMPNSEANGLIFPSAVKDYSEKIWIPTVEGVGIIDPSSFSGVPENSSEFIWDELHLGDQSIPIEGDVEIPQGVRMFQISFSLIDFDNPSQYSLFYRMGSKKENWLPIKDQRQLIFNGLKPGKYNLELKILRYGQLETIKTLSIRVIPTFFETTFFLVLLAVSAIFLIYISFQYYFNWKMKNRFEFMVSQRTSELSHTNEKLKDAFTEIEHQNSILKEITWNQSHLIRAPLTKAMGINRILINYPKYTKVGKTKEELEIELLETLNQLDQILKETHSISENLKKP